jgi:hypothetical protein
MLKLCEKAVGIPCGAVCWCECCGEAWAATKDWVAIRRAGTSVQSDGVVCDARRASGSCANLEVSVSGGASSGCARTREVVASVVPSGIWANSIYLGSVGPCIRSETLDLRK